MTEPRFDRTTALVTGGAGFIGSHLVDALASRGAAVRVLDNLSSGRRENLARRWGHVELYEDDIRDLEACRRACRGVGTVFHQAARGSVPLSIEDPATTFAINVAGTANVFAAARDAGVRRVVYASSAAVYGDSPEMPRREGREGAPLSPYAASKGMCEELAAVYGRCYGLEIIGLRYFNVYGPRQRCDGPYASAIPRFLDACVNGRPPTVHGDGGQSRDFLFVADAVGANLLAAAAPARVCGRAYNVATGRETRVLELVEIIRRLAGGGPEPVYEPARAGDVRGSLADLTRCREALGYRPRYDLEAAIEETLASLKVSTGKSSG